MKKSTIFTGIGTILFYLLFLYLFIKGVIGATLFLFILISFFIMLFICLLIFIILFFFLRQKLILGEIGLATGILLLFICYEFPLMFFPDSLVIAYAYLEPNEVLEDANIYSIGVKEIHFENLNSEIGVEEIFKIEQEDVLSVFEVDNKMLYALKTEQWLDWLHFTKEQSTDESKKHVMQYLGEEEQWVESFFANPRLIGESAGLSLALAGRLKQKDIDNQLDIAVTGAIDEKGNVFAIGSLREKIQITEKAGISYIIIPSENVKEVEIIQKDTKANVEIYDVSTVEEAIKVIETLNK